MSDDTTVRIYASADRTDGLLMQGRLESEGIQVLLKGESEGPYRMGPTYLWVSSADEVLARQIVDAVRSGAYELAEDADVGSEISTPAEDPAPR